MADAKPKSSPPKPRIKRPRPTFDDGALTRHFKFPSKAYPRSTYYVTATEIIIRIRKARKKWKLLIPKKRLVSYRTNRWFAKPRFVEVELTFTQATRLGLVAPRAKPAAGDELVTDTVAHAALPMVVPAVDPAVDAPGLLVAEAAVQPEGDASQDALDAETEADAASMDETGFALEADTGEGDAGDDVDEREHDEHPDAFGREPVVGEPDLARIANTSDFAPSQPDADLAVGMDEPVQVEADMAACQQCPQPVGTAGSFAPVISAPEPAAIAPPQVPSATPPVTIADLAALAAMRRAPIHRPVAGRPPRRPAALVLSGLAILLAGAATVWHAQGDGAGLEVARVPPCVSTGPTTNCGVDFVTGALKSDERPSTPDAGPRQTASAAEVASPPSPARPAEAEVAAPSPPPAAVAVPDVPEPIKPDVAVEAPPTPAHPHVADGLPVSRVEANGADACTALPAIARAVDVVFEFASASLDASALPALDDLAARLRTCAAATVIIEGHADADGAPDRNQTLSVRRAQAVREHLVNAGLPPEQLWMIGFGQSRPSAPNDTADNKRRNRRAVLNVELPVRD